jgi:hypothetical protein
MSFKLNFRVVGLYLDFRGLADLKDPATGVLLEPNAKIDKIMTAIVTQNPSFAFAAGPTPSGKNIVSSMSYEYSGGSTRPENSSGTPPFGPRELNNFIDIDVSRVWQFYRGAIVDISGKKVEIEFPTIGQPSYTEASLNDGFDLGVEPISYILTWRLVTIDKLPEGRRNDLDHALRRAMAGR